MNPDKIIENLKTNYNLYDCYLACSGGVDSMVMLDLMHKAKLKLTVIHVNYHLRGNESNEDESFIKKYCQQNEIAFLSRQAVWNEIPGNIQLIAREMRYAWFKELLIDPYNRVFLGHHLDDQVETFYLNLARNAGVMGLACMLPENNGIVRPLLDFTKEEIRKYAINNGLKWREDSSNATLKYKRNILRNKILPEVRTVIPELNDSMWILIQHFQKKQKDLEERIEPLIQKVKSRKILSLGEFNILDEFELMEFLRQLNQPLRIYEEFQNFLTLDSGKKFEFPDKTHFIEAYVSKQEIHFIESGNEFVLPELVCEIVSELPIVFDKESVFLDAAKIKGELQLRVWKTGDRMKPVGMKGSKLISDIIHDENVSAEKKNQILVLHDDNEIHWCVGLKIGRTAVADENSKKIIKCFVEVNCNSLLRT